jgi:phosphohistidine phosphatase SixA
MRHAKSSWANEGQKDHERPLNERGQRDAPRIAQALSDLSWTPDWVVASDALRTRQTWERMTEVFGEDTPLLAEPNLYLAGLGALQKSAAAWPSSATTLLALGHNPGWEQAVSHLCGTSCSMTTANAGLLEGYGGSWQEALEGAWELREFLTPKGLS